MGDPGLGCPWVFVPSCDSMVHPWALPLKLGAIPSMPSVQTGWKLPWDMMKAAFPEKGSAGGLDVWGSEESSD